MIKLTNDKFYIKTISSNFAIETQQDFTLDTYGDIISYYFDINSGYVVDSYGTIYF